MNYQTSDHHLAPLPHITPPLSKPSQNMFQDLTKNVNFGEDIDFVLGVTATALAADQLLKLNDSKKHKKMHLAKAALSAAAAAAAFTIMRREYNEHHRPKSPTRERARHGNSAYDAGWDYESGRRRPRSHSPVRYRRDEDQPLDDWAMLPGLDYHHCTPCPEDGENIFSGPESQRHARSLSSPAHHHRRTG
ncbi:hypothetical protein C8A00DRAFT_37610 [Chaetomidium leptoderma]|uniref:Uncharacterized protein n=1 Tax=Chaetomidium leptoderma TaxID=669021 RepID=A0AAN6VE44_9PEZI|nr:hypothetical protein C8A00DRAFT_37610 [Chaetomidium leptoderma]